MRMLHKHHQKGQGRAPGGCARGLVAVACRLVQSVLRGKNKAHARLRIAGAWPSPFSYAQSFQLYLGAIVNFG
jgi:hypothetical protein